MAFHFFKAIREIISGKSDSICTISTIGALMEGVYGGVVSCSELKKYGDFGLGTFDSLDGEMLMFENHVYRADQSGTISEASDKDTIAYAAIKFFRADKQFELKQISSVGDLAKRVSDEMGVANSMLAVKITGSFERVKLRAVPKQMQPYPHLEEVAKHQSEFELKGVEGTLIGFRFPVYTGELSVPGFHFHLLTEDKKHGGHVLEVNMQSGHAECDISRELHAILPDSEAFDAAALDMDHASSIHKAES
jgi:acetolactate decarboxylase